MKKILSIFCALLAIQSIASAASHEWQTDNSGKYAYRYITNDPYKVRFYTLKNGFTVIMSVSKDEPRLQTMIATKAGSNTDPANHTGLAHYLEHMLFKGTDKFGTLDWNKEKPLIDKIDDLYEQYNSTTDETQRTLIYAKIDSVSGVAAKFSIANEYDKMMSTIGAKGTNAFTWVEQTVYVNDIPTNQIERWLTIESERFRYPVFRLFHTELEAVYEEKNRSLDNDEWKVNEVLMASLFPTHNYGQQTTIGTIEHLKNPSLKEIRKYYDTYYVPNNMCMVLVGDYNPDSVIALVDEQFGKFESKIVPPYVGPKEADITAPIEKTVIGPKDEWVSLAFRMPGENSKETGLLQVTDRLLANGTAGLIDINLVKKQKVLEATGYVQSMKDYSIYEMDAKPKEGQTLAEVKTLLLQQIENIKKGNFDESLLQAVKNNFEKEQMQNMEKNQDRANALLDDFIKDVSWKDDLDFYNEIKNYNKGDIIAFANKWFLNNYVVVYKKAGKDTTVIKVNKPLIHEVEVNRNAQSGFVQQIASMKPAEIKPVFLNFQKDIDKGMLNKVPVFVTPNKNNQLFSLYCYFDMGSNNLKKLPIALEYLKYLGTDRYSSEEINKEFYKLATNFTTNSGQRSTYIQIDGLNDNFIKSLDLIENLLLNCQPDQNKLVAFINDYIQSRNNEKSNKYAIMKGLSYISTYGTKNPFNYQLSDKELKELRAEELVKMVKNLTKYPHKILYYGPLNKQELLSILSVRHKGMLPTRVLPDSYPFSFRKTTTKEINFANYDMVQTEITWNRNSDNFNVVNIPIINLFNEYYGGGMSGVVFQTIRESKALAYSTFANYGIAYKKGEPNNIKAYIGCQADKMNDAIIGMQELLDTLPYSEKLFEITKNALKNNYSTSRILKQQILFTYLTAQRYGINYDTREKTYQLLDKFTFNDLNAFHQKSFSKKPYSICLIGDDKKIKWNELEKYGKVRKYTLEEIFGY
jgi:predicted Zn-dependent peptidase